MEKEVVTKMIVILSVKLYSSHKDVDSHSNHSLTFPFA